MKVILRADVDTVGKRGDVVDVADGYARNYLIPRGAAMRADLGADAQAEAMRRAREVQDAKDREEAQALASSLVPQVIQIRAKVGAQGRLFGSVSAADIAAAVHEQTGHELDRKWILIDEPIKETGSHMVMASLHSEVQFPITLEVFPIE